MLISQASQNLLAAAFPAWTHQLLPEATLGFLARFPPWRHRDGPPGATGRTMPALSPLWGPTEGKAARTGHFTLEKILQIYFSFHLDANPTKYSSIFLSISFLGSLLYANHGSPPYPQGAALQDLCGVTGSVEGVPCFFKHTETQGEFLSSS